MEDENKFDQIDKLLGVLIGLGVGILLILAVDMLWFDSGLMKLIFG